MKILPFAIPLFFFSGCKTDYKEIVEKYRNGQPKEVRVYKSKSNKRNYQLTWYYENGQIQFKGTVINEKFTGQKINYYDNGNLKEIDSLISPCDLNYCCCDGKVVRFDTSGKLVEDFENRNGVENGIVNTYNKQEKLRDKYEMRDGKKNGLALAFYENGTPLFQASFANDTIVGFIYYFDENGDTTKYFNHYKGEMDFPYKKWLGNGLVLYGDFINSKRKSILWQWFDKSGKEVKREMRQEEKSGFIAPN